VAIGALRGAEVIATADPKSHDRVKTLGAAHVIDYHDERWPERARKLAAGAGVDAAANAVPGGAAQAMQAVRDGGRLATITSDPPPARRQIAVSSAYVRPSGAQLTDAIRLVADGRLTIQIGASFGLADARRALEAAVRGLGGRAVVIEL
jgi:NADPH:quinone reductase-like Zn-dependent oxidoreductase